MCGIVGACAQRDVAAILLEGLKRLEYRGYDSAGIAILDDDKNIRRLRTQGKVNQLVEAYEKTPLLGRTGIAHTRWATHGKPSEINAHPHLSNDQIAVVHNGIIENHEQLREGLMAAGYELTSETDTEIIVHLIHQKLDKTHDLLKAVQATVKELRGAFALAITDSQHPGRIIAVRAGSPLVLGIGIGELFVASDCLALMPVTQRFVYLEEDDMVDIQLDGYQIYDKNAKATERTIETIEVVRDSVDKGHYRHFMQKEIHEQPKAIADTLESRLGQDKIFEQIFGDDAPAVFSKLENIHIVACGTSYHAGMVARYWLESIAGINCSVEIASEYRYRDKVIRDNTLFICISQSGETADTLAALRQAKALNYLSTLAICNVAESALVREAKLVFMTRAGVEIGVASTKAFTTQLVALLLLTLTLGRKREDVAELIAQVSLLPGLMKEVLALDLKIRALAEHFADKQHALFLGRGVEYPIALEGALKLKELSYIHAEAYPAGELKHGPLALVDDRMPVVAVAPNDQLLEKLKSNLHEVQARGGELFIFADQDAALNDSDNLHVISMPKVPSILSPILYTVPLQLLAYHVAVIKGTDVDQPRNLAKSVTVE